MASEEIKTLHVPPLPGIKLTIENRGGIGGDWERNIGGTNSEKRIAYEGPMTDKMLTVLVEAIMKLTD